MKNSIRYTIIIEDIGRKIKNIKGDILSTPVTITCCNKTIDYWRIYLKMNCFDNYTIHEDNLESIKDDKYKNTRRDVVYRGILFDEDSVNTNN